MKTKKAEKTADFAALVTDWQSRLVLTNSEAAALLGVTTDAIVKWRGGSSAPSRVKWRAVARTLGLSVEDLAVAIAQGVKS